MRYVLLTHDGTPLAIAEAPTLLDVCLYGHRHVRSFRRSITESEFREPHKLLRASFERRYIAEGVAPDIAKARAEVAAGPEQWLPVVQVPAQPAPLKPAASAESVTERDRRIQQIHGDAVSIPGRGGAR